MDVEKKEGKKAENCLASINYEVKFYKITKIGGEFVKANDIIKKITEKVLSLN